MSQAQPVYRHYETVFLVRPDTVESDLDGIKKRISDVIEAGKGKVCRWENWGKRKLAYEIAKQQKANYFYVNFVTLHSSVYEIERNLRIMEQVLQHQTVRIAETVDPNAFDYETESKKKTPLYLTPEEAAALERAYREAWGDAGAFDGDDDGDGDDMDEEEVR